MVSQSAAWFAITASETIPTVTGDINLPGIGSYIGLALTDSNIAAILYALIAIIINIVLFDQLLFRPLVKWSEKFKYESINHKSSDSPWLYHSYNKSKIINYLKPLIANIIFWLMNDVSFIIFEYTIFYIHCLIKSYHLYSATITIIPPDYLAKTFRNCYTIH